MSQSSAVESPLRGAFALVADADTCERMSRAAWAASGVPARHATTCIRATDGWTKAARAAASVLQRPAMLALIGPRGTGKTQLAVELIREFCRSGRTGIYTRTMDFLIEVRDTYGDRATKRERDVLRKYRVPELLVLDEVQVRGSTEWEANMLTNLIDWRYAANASTLLISNLTATAFIASVGDSIASRLMETGGIISCEWQSFRDQGEKP